MVRSVEKHRDQRLSAGQYDPIRPIFVADGQKIFERSMATIYQDSHLTSHRSSRRMSRSGADPVAMPATGISREWPLRRSRNCRTIGVGCEQRLCIAILDVAKVGDSIAVCDYLWVSMSAWARLLMHCYRPGGTASDIIG